MGRRLSNEEGLKSFEAAKSFLRENDWDTTSNNNVLVQTNGDIIFNSKVDVSVGVHLDYYNIEIMWEDVLENHDYKKLGLFGYYSTNFCPMKYSEGVLIIYGDNNMQINIIS